MPRKPRLHVPGGLYHVVLRGNNRQALFFSVADRLRLQQLVAKSCRRLGNRVHAFCWMTNHLHLAVQVADQPLGRMMQWIASRYAYYLNRRLGRTGHVFERRYRPVLVDADTYLLELIRYIHRNPLKAGMVKDPADYRWCSHRCYLGRETLTWLTTDWVLALFADDVCRARQRYSHFVLDPTAAEPPSELLFGSTFDARVAGSNDLLEALYDRGSEEQQPLSLDDIIARICAEYEVTEAMLSGRARRRHLARVRARIATEAIQSGTASLADIARRFRRAESVVYRTMMRYRKPE